MKTLEDVFAFYRQRHLSSQNKSLWQFIEKLNLNPEKLTEALELGVADRAINNHLAPRNNATGREQRAALVESGIFRDTGFEKAVGLVIPLYEDGQLVNLFSYAYRCKQPYKSMVHDSKGAICIFPEHTQAVIVDCPLDLLILAHFDLKKTLIYTADKDLLKPLTLNKEAVYVLNKKELVAPQYRLIIPSQQNFFDFYRAKIVTQEDIEKLINTAPAFQAPSLPQQAQQNINRSLTKKGEFHYLTISDLTFRIAGLEKNNTFHSFKVTLKLTSKDSDCFYMDQLDLCVDKQRLRFAKRASQDLGISEGDLKVDLGRLLLAIEQHQEKHLLKEEITPEVELTEQQRLEALEFLQSEDLIARLQQDFVDCGMVGENLNRLIGYLTCTSRLLDKPLGSLIQSSSSAGKTTIQKAVLKFFPDEEVMNFSSITAQSLYYMGETSISHKILAIAEEEGSHNAAYALKLLLSEGELAIASTGKDSDTGATTTHTYKVEGRVSLLMTSTSLAIDPELENRMLVVSANETKEQTKAIHAAQKNARTMKGIVQRAKSGSIIERNQNAQRLLKAYPVVNPFVDDLQFDYHNTRSRRDFDKFLSLIDTIVLLHQYQRKAVTKEINGKTITALVAEQADIDLAAQLAEVLFERSADLSPRTLKVWQQLKVFITKQAKETKQDWHDLQFTRRQVRELLGASITATKKHLDALVEHEFVIPVRGKFGSKFCYQLLISPDGQGKPITPKG